MRFLSFLNSISVCLFLAYGVGCTGGSSGSPDEQFEHAYTHIQNGELVEAYSEFVPPSYARDLDEVLSKAKELITEAEFTRIQASLKTFGAQLSKALEGVSESSVQGLADPLKSIGVTSYADFSKIDLKGILTSLQAGLFQELMQHPEVEKRLGEVEFTVVEEKGDTAKLHVKHMAPDGKAQEETQDLVRVEGRWIPATMASEWKQGIESMRSEIAGAIAAKTANPDLFKQQLDALDQQLQMMAGMIPFLLKGMQGQE